jgi:hypothetical protein
MEEIVFLSKPRLNNPILIATWPGIGEVALGAGRYLRQGLETTEFARLNPLPYFDLAGVFVEENVIQSPRFPQNTFHCWHDPKGVHDLVFFEGEAQPSVSAYKLAHKVLDIAEDLGVGRVFTFAAAIVPELPSRPRVWASATDPGLAEQLAKYEVVLRGDFYIAGMNGILLAVAKERGIEAICLLGETPRFLPPHRTNPVASLAILEVLTQLLDLPVDLSPLRSEARKAQQELERLVMESRKEFIDRFTIPLWEKGDEEDKA